MELTQGQYDQISDCFPKHRGKLTYSNLQAINAFLYMAENGCKWRSLPEKYGNWHTLCYRLSRRAKGGVLDRFFAMLQEKQTVRIKIDVISMDGTSVNIHPDAAGALKKRPQSIGISRGGRNTKIHTVAASDGVAVAFRLSGGQCHDAPQGRLFPEDIRLNKLPKRKNIYMAMDKGCEDDSTRKLAVDKGFEPLVPPKSNRRKPWVYDKERYKRRNETERLFRRLKGFGRVCTRYEKLDLMYLHNL